MSRIPRLLWLALPAAYLLYFFRLGAIGLIGPDEPRYAAIGRAMAASGDWITPRLWGQPWFEKPALLYWMSGAAFGSGSDRTSRRGFPWRCFPQRFSLFSIGACVASSDAS